MNFCEAMTAVCEGKKVLRNGHSHFLRGDVVYMHLSFDDFDKKAYFTSADILATDWEVV